MSNLIIKGARVISPKGGLDGKFSVHVKGTKIAGIHKSAVADGKIDSSATIIDATGLTLTPGLIDMHVHLREPGYEYKETIASGTHAAAHGGVTSVACMANTDPVNDSASVTKYITAHAEKEGYVNVFPIGAMTKGLKGAELAEYGDMKGAGCVAVSDDGHTVMDALVMRRVMEYAKTFGLLCISHAEDMNLARGGQINESVVSTRLGLKGIPAQAEEVIVARDILIAGLTGCRLHIAHVSTKGAVELIRAAKKRGVPVTCETAPHYFTLTDSDIKDYDTNFKVNPPIRGESDRKAIIKGLADGTIDAIASDHAPHHKDEKELEFMNAAFGISGIETMLPLSLRLVNDKTLTLGGLVEKLSEKPAEILGLTGKGVIEVGADADLTLIDTKKEFTLTQDDIKSKGKNSPFYGYRFKGCAKSVIVNGRSSHH